MKARITILALTLTALLAAGPQCAQNQDTGNTTTLRVANWGSPAVDPLFMRIERELREGFEASQPGAQVRFEQIPGFGQYAPKLLMMHVTGSMPDALSLDASSGAVFMDNNVLQDLTPFIEKDKSFKLDDFFPNAVNAFRRGNKLYAIPFDFTPMMIYYNKRLFDAAGVPYPKAGWTWDDFLTTAQALTIRDADARKPPKQYGYFFMNVMPFWMLWHWTAGGDVLSPDGRQASGYFDGPLGVEAMQFQADLMYKYRVAPTLAESKAAGVDLFLNERAAMDLKGHWMMIDYRQKGIDFGVVPLPTKSGKPVTVVYVTGLSIAGKAQHPELAWEYIKYMTSRDVQIKRVSSGLAISGNRQAAAHYAGTQMEDAFIAAVADARPPWGSTVERYPLIEGLGEEMVEDLMSFGHGQRVAQEMARTAKLMDAVLSKP